MFVNLCAKVDQSMRLDITERAYAHAYVGVSVEIVGTTLISIAHSTPP